MPLSMQDTAPAGLTAGLVRFIQSASAMHLDEAVVRTVCDGFSDCVAAMLAGRGEPVVGLARRYAAARDAAGGRSHLLFGPDTGAAWTAAMVNATASHALDYDDVGLGGHPSAVLVPALLAEGERLGASGAALVRAYVVGYEIWAELIARDQDAHHLKGWHPTAVFGTVAVAAAVAALRGAEPSACTAALGLAATTASGLVANFGAMAKPLHAGFAAARGIDAVELAQAGVGAAPDVIEHPSGFLAALSPAGRVDRGPARATLGDTLAIRRIGLSIKKYPVCFAAHRLIDAAIGLADKHGLTAAQVADMQATVGMAQAAMLRNHAPRDALEARFSLEFALAAAIAVRRVGLAELSDGFVRRPDVVALMRRVRIETAPGRHAAEPVLAPSDRLRITTSDGTVLDSGDVREARGTPRLPLAEGELLVKFLDCALDIPAARAGRLCADLQALDEVADVGTLARDFLA